MKLFWLLTICWLAFILAIFLFAPKTPEPKETPNERLNSLVRNGVC
jgi:hypothetical protein